MSDRPKNRIEEIRKARGYSMEELAQRANTTASQINKLEKGRVSLTLEWMYRLANALDCHWSELPADTPPAPALAPREEAMLNLYRGLSEAQQAAMLRLVDTMAQPSPGTDDNQEKKSSG